MAWTSADDGAKAYMDQVLADRFKQKQYDLGCKTAELIQEVKDWDCAESRQSSNEQKNAEERILDIVFKALTGEGHPGL